MVCLTVEQARAIEALLEIKDRQDILIPQMDKEIMEIRELVRQALERVKKAEEHAATMDELNSDLSMQNTALEKDMKEIKKQEKKRRWRWLLCGIGAGLAVGLVAGLSAN